MIYRLLCALGLLAAVGFTTEAAAQDKILFNVFTPPKANPSRIIYPWMKDINAASKGALKMEAPAKSLAPPPRQMDIVTQGIADGAFIFTGFLQKRIPHVQFSIMPLTHTSAVADGVALWRTYNKFFKAKNPYKDVVLLGFFSGAGGHFYSLKDKPISTAADFKTMKMWSLPAWTALSLKNMGTAVVPGPAVRIYPIVSKGTVDAYAGLDMADSYAFNVAQFAKSVTEVPGAVFSPTFSVFLSKAKWAKLSKANRDLILSMSGEKLARRAKSWDDGVKGATAKFKKAGGKIAPASAALTTAYKGAVGKVYKAWFAEMKKMGVDGKAVMDFYQAEAKKVASGG